MAYILRFILFQYYRVRDYLGRPKMNLLVNLDITWANSHRYVLDILGRLIQAYVADVTDIYRFVNYSTTYILSFGNRTFNGFVNNLVSFFQFLTLPIFVYVNCILFSLPVVIRYPSILIFQFPKNYSFSWLLLIALIFNIAIYIISFHDPYWEYICSNYRPFNFRIAFYNIFVHPFFLACRKFINALLNIMDKIIQKFISFLKIVANMLKTLVLFILKQLNKTSRGIMAIFMKFLNLYNSILVSGTKKFKSMGYLGEILSIPYTLLWMFWPIIIPFLTKITILYLPTVSISLGLVIRGYAIIRKTWND